MMIGTDYPQNHLPDDDGIGFLADVAPILSAADLAFGNLEGVLWMAASQARNAVTRAPATCFAHPLAMPTTTGRPASTC